MKFIVTGVKKQEDKMFDSLDYAIAYARSSVFHHGDSANVYTERWTPIFSIAKHETEVFENNHTIEAKAAGLL